MLPALAASTTSSNPRFEALYNDLCKNKLRADGSTVPDVEEQKSRSVFETDLYQARLQAARRDVIIAAMRALSYKPDGLPTEVHELVTIAAAQLEGQFTGEDEEIAHDATSNLKDHMPTIAKSLSSQVRQDAAMLNHMTKDQKGSPPDEVIKTWKAAISKSRNATLDIHRQQTAVAQQTHATYRQLIELCIKALEQTIHGAVSRGTKAKADYLVVVLEGMAKKLEVQYAQLITQLDTDDARAALKARNQELAKQHRQLKGQLRDREDTLDDLKRELKGNSLATEYLKIMKETRALEQQD